MRAGIVVILLDYAGDWKWLDHFKKKRRHLLSKTVSEGPIAAFRAGETIVVQNAIPIHTKRGDSEWDGSRINEGEQLTNAQV